MTTLVQRQEFLVETSLAGAGDLLSRELIEEKMILTLLDEEHRGLGVELAILGLQRDLGPVKLIMLIPVGLTAFLRLFLSCLGLLVVVDGV